MTKIYDIDPVMVDVPMPIRTPRLLLRPPQMGDGSKLFEAKCASWPALKAWMPWAERPEEHTAEKDEIMCRKQYARYLLREDLMTLIFDTKGQKVLGSSGLHRMDWKARTFEIGYWVRSDETAKGYASEVTNALLRYAFSVLAANRVCICHDRENLASRRVIEKLGFCKEGESLKSAIRDGNLSDTCHYARYDLMDLPPLEVTWGEPQI
jgi:RimJ/RimL family protein N-acetyltransferase